MSSPNFASILNRPVAEIERPPNVPVGTYRAKVSKHPELDQTPDGKWNRVNVQMKLVEASDDVDQEALAKFGGLGSNPAATVRRTFMMSTDDTDEVKANNERTIFNLKSFMSDHLKVEGETLKELFANSIGAECMVTIRWRPDKNDPEIQYAEIGKTAPIV